jgi:hypothetical protein
MQFRITVIVLVLLCGAIAMAGCTGTPASPVGGPGTPAASATPGSGSSSGTLTTVPTDVLPSYNMVQVDVGEKDSTSGVIPVIFQGGMGMNSIKKVDVKLTRVDGTVQTATVGTNKGDEVELQGTRGEGSLRGQADRVEVWVTTNQIQTYKIVDVLREYRSR